VSRERRRAPNGHAARTPIIAVTADTDAGTTGPVAWRPAMDDFFTKPVRKAMLQTVVEALGQPLSRRCRHATTDATRFRPRLDQDCGRPSRRQASDAASEAAPLDPNAIQALRDLEHRPAAGALSRA